MNGRVICTLVWIQIISEAFVQIVIVFALQVLEWMRETSGSLADNCFTVCLSELFSLKQLPSADRVELTRVMRLNQNINPTISLPPLLGRWRLLSWLKISPCLCSYERWLFSILTDSTILVISCSFEIIKQEAHLQGSHFCAVP